MGTHPIFESDFDCLTDMKVLITGGGGFIGSHAVVETLADGHKVVVLDDCSNIAPPKTSDSMPPSLERVKEIVGSKIAENLSFVRGCITDKKLVTEVLQGCDTVMHFAGLKAVGESSQKPLDYYRVNVGGTVNLLQCMSVAKCNRIIFSSSATVYKPAKTVEDLPWKEDCPTGECSCPYARTKLFVEEILQDACIADKSLRAVSLRYFNPVGAHPSGLIGEDPLGIPNNLMPYVAQVAIGRRPHLNVFGNDYKTRDGTGVRDYIHVVDLAKGHVAAIQKLSECETKEEEEEEEGEESKIEENLKVIETNGQILPPTSSSYERQSLGCIAINLGTGNGVSVLELVEGMRSA